MNTVVIMIGALYLLSAVIVVASKSSFQAVIWFGIMGSLSAIVMLLAGAPDVAMTQFTVGVALVLIVYIMALKRQRRVRLGFVNVPSMIEIGSGGLKGLEWEIMKRIDEKEGYHIEAAAFESKETAIKAVEEHEIDILCGAFTEEELSGSTRGIAYLETSIFDFEGVEVDFVKLKQLSRSSVSPRPVFLKKSNYVFVVSKSSGDLAEALSSDIENMTKEGKMQEIVGRYL